MKAVNWMMEAVLGAEVGKHKRQSATIWHRGTKSLCGTSFAGISRESLCVSLLDLMDLSSLCEFSVFRSMAMIHHRKKNVEGVYGL